MKKLLFLITLLSLASYAQSAPKIETDIEIVPYNPNSHPNASEKKSPYYSKIKFLLDQGMKMEKLRKTESLSDNIECIKLMHSYQPQAKALRDQLEESDNIQLRKASIELITCVSCMDTAIEWCKRGFADFKHVK